jgi:choline-sulfatase
VHMGITSDLVTDHAIRWIDQFQNRRADEPFFLFLHYFDPHYNYRHHPEFDLTAGYEGPLRGVEDIRKLRAMIPGIQPPDLQYLKGLYHEEVAFTSYHIGRLLDHLRQTGLDRNILLVLMADHGEEFLERGWIGHGRTLYNEVTQVPLVFSAPSLFTARRVQTPVSGLDVLPTIADLLGMAEKDEGWEGRSLVPELFGREQPQAFDLISEVQVDAPGTPRNAHQTSLIRGNLKLIHDRDRQRWELYDLAADPGEMNNLAALKPEAFEAMSQQISVLEHRKPNQLKASDELELNPKEVDQLKSLGYL